MEKNDGKDIIEEMKELMDQRVKDILLCKPEKIKKDIFYMKLDQAKLGMSYIRDREVMKRISSGQIMRMVTVITTDPVERKKYIEASMPEFSIVKQIGGK